MLLVSLSACSVSQFNPLQTDQNFITIGSGGGFSGIETQYHIVETGQVYKQVGLDSDLTHLKPVKEGTIKQALRNCQQFELLDYQYQNPGNTYEFLTIHHGSRSNRIVWGGKSLKEVRPVCTQIYGLLHGIIINAENAKN